MLMTSCRNSIYVVHNGTLYKVDPNDGQWHEFEADWGSAKLMTGHSNGLLYIIAEDILYQVDPDNGNWVELESDWGKASVMTSNGNRLFIIDSGTLYWFNTDTNESGAFEGDWS